VSIPHLQKSSVGTLSFKSRVAQTRGYALLLLAFLYLLFVLTNWVSEWAVLLVTFVTFAISWPFMTRLPQILSITMLCLGQLLFVYYDGDKSYWLDALFQNLAFVALFVSVPLLSIPIRVGGYVEFIVALMHRFHRRPVLMHTIVSGLSFLLTSFMNIGSVRIMDELFGSSFRDHRDRFIKAVMQGFSLSAMFSPYIAGVAIVLFLLHVPLFHFFMYGLLLVLTGFGITIGISYSESIDKNSQSSSKIQKIKMNHLLPNDQLVNYNKGIELVVAFICLFVTIIMLERWFHINLVIIISLIAVTFPFIWIFLIHKQASLRAQLDHYSKHVLPNVHNESVMIISASFFAQMVQLSPLPDFLSQAASVLTSYTPFLVILTILLSIFLLSLAGVHQILPVTVYASSFTPIEIGIDPVLFALVLASGWGMGSLIAPISALNIVCSNLFGLDWSQLSKWNIKFVICIIVSTTILIYTLNVLITGTL
jgi:TRAP-type C4-dicarboxylate transport system permease large subunit